MKQIIKSLKLWCKKITCNHPIKSVRWIDYQDGYISTKCDKCGKIVYEDLCKYQKH